MATNQWLLTLVLLVGCSSAAPFVQRELDTSPVRILSWNIESGGSDTNTILRQLYDLPPCEILALSEVAAADIPAWQARFASGSVLAGTKGGNDRLLLICSGRFELVRAIELLEWKGEEVAPGGHRAPLMAHLKDLDTGDECIAMNNHLARSDADIRTKQAELLVDWARDQTLPIVAVGDYNMDYDFPTKKGNAAFAAMLHDVIYEWIQPDRFIDTNWADRNGDGVDDYPDSMLDFVFVAGRAKDWQVSCSVIVRDGDFPDDDTTSDHSPILTITAE